MEDQGPRVPLNSIFASQFKRITRKKWRVFVLNVAISDPHIAFLRTKCINQGRIDHNMAQYQLGASAQIVTFFSLPLHLAESSCKNPQSAGGPVRCKTGPEITRLVGVTIYCTVFQ